MALVGAVLTISLGRTDVTQARASVAATDNQTSLYTLAGWGGFHAVGNSLPLSTIAYWQGWDIARGLALNAAGTGGYVLDGWGGVHPVGTAQAVASSASWPGWDIARGVALDATGDGGSVLDGWGGIHPFGSAPQVARSTYWNGWDIARGIATRSDGVSGYVLDGWGGIHPFGGAPAVMTTAYWQGFDIRLRHRPAAGWSERPRARRLGRYSPVRRRADGGHERLLAGLGHRSGHRRLDWCGRPARGLGSRRLGRRARVWIRSVARPDRVLAGLGHRALHRRRGLRRWGQHTSCRPRVSGAGSGSGVRAGASPRQPVCSGEPVELHPLRWRQSHLLSRSSFEFLATSMEARSTAFPRFGRAPTGMSRSAWI